jgi:hypothetical protein
MKRLTHPATIIATVALFAALAGGAVASVVIDGKHIKNHSIAVKKLTKSAVTSLHGDVYEVKQNGPSPATSAGTVRTLTLPNLPPGAYAIYGKASIDPTDIVDGSSSCLLTAGTDTDISYNPVRTDAEEWFIPNHTELAHTFTSTGTVTMACTAYNDPWTLGGDNDSGNSEIIAVRMGTAHVTSATAAAARKPSASRTAGHR